MSTLLVTSESSLPPNEHGSISGYLEIEVTRINFIAVQPAATNNNTPINQFNITKKKTKRCSIKSTTSRLSSVPIDHQQGVTVKFIWCGENSTTASGIHIVRADKEAPPPATPNKTNQNQQQQQHPQERLKCSKVRYSIQTSLRLFLEYLRSCETLEITVSKNVSNLPVGRAQVRLPKVFVRKFAANYVAATNFEHKSKIYALYTAQNGQSSKCGEFQLRFKIMFAHNAKQMLQEQLHSTLEKELQMKTKNGKFQDEKTAAGHNKFAVTSPASRKPSKTDEVVEAMMKIDAKLVAYLAGEEIKAKEEEEQQALALDRLQCSSPMNQLVGEMIEERFREQQWRIYQCLNTLKMHLEALTLQPAGTKYMELLEEDIKPIFTVECQLPNELIRHVPRYEMFHVMQFESGHFQSLTQCTRFAQDEEREIHLRPKEVEAARSDADADAGDNDDNKLGQLGLAFGKLSFAVWWRQPGTCLNEMLGMADFDVEELYKASLLQQCKCLAVKRRNIHMANLYFKIGFGLRRKLSADEQKLDCNGNEGSGNVSDGGDDEQSKKKQPPADAKEAKNMKSAAAAATITTTSSTTGGGGEEKSNDQMSDNMKGS